MTAETRTRVLLVEDDAWVAQVNREMVEELPEFVVVGVAEGVAEARRLVAEVPADLAIVDVYLPDGSGVEFVREVRSSGAALDVIMVTAARDATNVRLALTGGVIDYLIKPIDKARLHDALVRSRRRHALLSGAAPLSQAGLDRLLRHDPVTRLPKGIDASTLDAVRDVLRAGDAPLGAEEVGKRLGLNRVTAWRYLEYLAERGEVAVSSQYRATGRPQKMYAKRD